jgi:hypothetical protein
MDERIGVVMHEQPVGAVAAINLGHPQRLVLVGQTADFTVLPLDHYEHDGVVPDVRFGDLKLRLAGLEVARGSPQALTAGGPPNGFSR